MSGVAIVFVLAVLWSSPRQFGRWLAKVRIGYRAQMHKEGQEP